MSDEKKHITPADNLMGHLVLKGEPGSVYRSVRPKRRRKGELNDGQWAPGVKPKPKRT
jgi:hypothetical protein